MSTEFRESVWEGMVEADRLRRYYGKLAGRMAWQDRAMAVLALVLASLTAILAREGHELLLPTAIATAIIAALPLIFRLGGRITEAAYCSRRLGDLSVGWKELWQEVYSLQPHDAVEERLVERWKELATTVNEITALKERVPEDKKLAGATEEESYAYWRTKTDQASNSTAIARA